MYEDIPPEVTVEETVSNPLDPAEVVGFIGRNTKLGKPAVLLKWAAVFPDTTNNFVAVPDNPADLIEDEQAQLILLLENEVLVMSADDFLEQSSETTHRRDGREATMPEVALNNEKFSSFSRNEVEVGN